MRSSGSMRAQIGTLIIATSGIQLANGFFDTLISLRVAIEDFGATMAGLVLSGYFAGFTLSALRCGRMIDRSASTGSTNNERKPSRTACASDVLTIALGPGVTSKPQLHPSK